jgi:uncharacterized membrane protein
MVLAYANVAVMENVKYNIEVIAMIIESFGVVIIAIGSFFFIFRFLFLYLFRRKVKTFTQLRRELGKAILLGLEVLVAADIIATVSTEPTMEMVLVLGLIVIIRTFLSFALEVELEGRFPWQSRKA